MDVKDHRGVLQGSRTSGPEAGAFPGIDLPARPLMSGPLLGLGCPESFSGFLGQLGNRFASGAHLDLGGLL